MIFFENNMNIRDVYTIANTETFSSINDIGSLRGLSMIIKNIADNNITDDPNAKLYITEICHINNMIFNSDKDDGTIIILDNEDDLNKHVSIMANGTVRLICFNKLELIGDKHFNILYHKEYCFDAIVNCMTIFVDKTFGETGNKEKDNEDIIELICSCVDTHVAHKSGVNLNQFYNTPKMNVDVNQNISATYYNDILTPIHVIRLDYTANDINFILKYMMSVISILKNYFTFTKLDIKSFYKDKGMFAKPFSDNLKIIDVLYDDSENKFIEAANIIRDTLYDVRYESIL